MEKNWLEIGDFVIFLDSLRQPHKALVTNIFVGADWDYKSSPPVKSREYSVAEHIRQYNAVPCINLLFVMDDPKMEDQYGRQITRQTSCMHASSHTGQTFGMCWMKPDEYEAWDKDVTKVIPKPAV